MKVRKMPDYVLALIALSVIGGPLLLIWFNFFENVGYLHFKLNKRRYDRIISLVNQKITTAGQFNLCLTNQGEDYDLSSCSPTSVSLPRVNVFCSSASSKLVQLIVIDTHSGYSGYLYSESDESPSLPHEPDLLIQRIGDKWYAFKSQAS